MDLSTFGLEDLLLAALKSEIDSRDIYGDLSLKVKNAFLRERLKFLAGEEEKHREFVENLFRKRFSERDPVVPKSSKVPLPEIKFESDLVPVSEILSQAMGAEMAAHEFYKSLAVRFEVEEEVKKTLLYFAAMEMGHYTLLEAERENALEVEDYDVEWPMMHIGA